MNRTPPVAVRKALRQEVKFGCPVAGCGNPYLEYHHFAPAWSESNHHNPDGMIALCATHHAKADALTADQCRQLKQSPNTDSVVGRFDWMRDQIISIVGGNYYFETPRMVVFRGEPVVWYERDSQGHMLLSLNMLTTSRSPRARLVRNDWEVLGEPVDVVSPPSGKNLEITYDNEDRVAIVFREWNSLSHLTKDHPRLGTLSADLKFPLVTTEVEMVVGGTDVRFDAKSSQVGGVLITGSVMSHCAAGLAFG